jgi:outer membrane protein assembly factor BamA
VLRILLCSTVLLFRIQAQNAAVPLELVSLEGTALSKEFVLEMAGLRVGSPIDKAGIDAACGKLRDSGIFVSIGYRYSSSPKRGYALSLTVADQSSLVDAEFDFPGIDGNELWQWLVAQYPSFNRKVPDNEVAQKFIAGKLEQYLGARLEEQRVVTRLEADLAPRRRMVISFQPEALPMVGSLSFTGNRELASGELSGRVQKIVGDQGYTDRHFRTIVEMNLRRAYEERGFYRVRFPNITARKATSSMEVTVAVEEGPQYTLGEVQLIGDKIPAAAMLEAADFKKGQVANWTEIQNGIWAMEKPLKRTGYYSAAAKPERVLRDDQRVLDLKISFSMGPLYRFGELRISGLPAGLEAEARKVWMLRPGDPFDYAYPTDFYRDFVRSAGAWKVKKFDAKMKQGTGDNVMDFTLLFELR